MGALVIQRAQRPRRRIAGEGADTSLVLLIDRKENPLPLIEGQPGGVDHPRHGLHRVEPTRIGIKAKDRDAFRGAQRRLGISADVDEHRSLPSTATVPLMLPNPRAVMTSF